MANILLAGLESTIAGELSGVLKELGQNVQSADCVVSTPDPAGVQLVFAPEALLAEVQRCYPGVPVIVVSRMPEVSSWLRALELGAADYCGAPFEATQVRWVLNTALAA